MSNQKRDDIMSDTIRETSPMITPDSLRKINQMNRAFYETHTKKNFGRTDVLGSQYSGTVENFGFEMLLEARKQKMEKPSLQGVFEINDYKYYFDLQYSNMIETYEQQGMLEAVLKKDVFLPDKEYRLEFTDCEEVYVPRSESWGALNDSVPPNVYKDKFYHTRTAPTLLIKDLRTLVVTRVDLKLEVAIDFASDYYFYNGFATEKFIADYTAGTLLTNPITNDDAELAFVWICVEIFKSLPPVDFIGNTPVVRKPILTIGVDGHNNSHIYPGIYGVDTLPDQGGPGKWYLKAKSELDGFMPDNVNNYKSKISNIYYTFEPTGGVPVDYEIMFQEDYIKITLSDKVEWEIIRDNINSPYYAKTDLDSLIEINGESPATTALVESFDIGFSETYLFDPYEGLCEGAQSGIHVDVLSDYSENSVPKENGTIHSLGKFDGLPSYFKDIHDRVIHRSHVELYTIRDRLNRFTQNPLTKQTAALLFDSAMPMDDLKNLISDQEPAIVYQPDPDAYLYVTDPDKVISEKNIVSEITYNSDTEFGNCRIPSDRNKQRFIYHGNRTFSLGAVEFDPELEMGRVYYVNNDSITYVNNASIDSEHRKAPLTLARICDIPTTYEQLMHVKNTSATYLFDQRYVRMGANFFNEDLNLLANERGLKIVMTPGIQGDQWIYPLPMSLPTKQTLVESGYFRTINIDNSEVPITSSNFSVLSAGVGYEVDDTFYVLVGGKAFDGVVTRTALTGNVVEVEITVPDDGTVSVYNLDGTHTPLKTTTVSSEVGTGLQIELVLSQTTIDQHFPGTDVTEPPENLVAFATDIFGNIFLYGLQPDWTWEQICQVEGEEFRINEYDDHDTWVSRTFNSVFFEYLLKNPNYADEDIFFDPMSYIVEDERHDYEPARGHQGSSESTDLSEYIIGRNMPNTFYKLECYDHADGGHFNLKTYELESLDGFETSLPRFNLNNTWKYYNPSNRLLISYAESLNKYQPSLFVYSPSHNTRIDGYTLMSDMVLEKSSHITNYNDYGSDIMDSSGILNANVYYYPEYEFSDDHIATEEYFRTKQRSELIEYIRNTFGSNADPFMFEDTDYRYDYDKLIDYIMERYPIDGPAYVKGGLKVHGYAGDPTIDPSTGKPLGKPVTGGVIPLTAEIFKSKVTVDGRKEESEPVNIFIIDDATFSGFSDDFRVHDENGIDITSTSIIIWRHNKYAYRMDPDTGVSHWITLAKPIKEAYYNPTDRMFYYDPQYANIITPDPDIIYCDINTGQYYKWNGVSYVLIII